MTAQQLIDEVLRDWNAFYIDHPAAKQQIDQTWKFAIAAPKLARMLKDEIPRRETFQEFYLFMRTHHGHRGDGYDPTSALREATDCFICQTMEQTKNRIYELDRIAGEEKVNRKTPQVPTDWELGNELLHNVMDNLSEAAGQFSERKPELADLLRNQWKALRPWYVHLVGLEKALV